MGPKCSDEVIKGAAIPLVNRQLMASPVIHTDYILKQFNVKRQYRRFNLWEIFMCREKYIVKLSREKH